MVMEAARRSASGGFSMFGKGVLPQKKENGLTLVLRQTIFFYSANRTREGNR